MAQVLELKDLTVSVAGSDKQVIRDISLSISAGEVHALIGESGSGKTTVALSALHHFRPGLRRGAGQISLSGVELTEQDGEVLREMRGNRICYVAQSAAAAFNPARRIDDQIAEIAREHEGLTTTDALNRSVDLFREMDLPDPESIGQRYPHEVSGGQLQRVMAAMAMVPNPDLIVFDEPTTALDVTTQVSVLMSFKKLIQSKGTAAIFVSHDLAVVAQIADSVTVLRDGEIVEQAHMSDLLANPQEHYSRKLLEAGLPDLAFHADRHGLADVAPILALKNITAGYGPLAGNGLLSHPVLQDIDMELPQGAVVGIIGESGSGKSTLAKVVSGLLPQANGQILLEGSPLPPRLETRSLDMVRDVQLVSQYADTALNPRHSIRRILERPVIRFTGDTRANVATRINEIMESVALPTHLLDRTPGELSGGQKQRVNLARALAADPKVLLCDEVTSALDAIVRDSIVDLILDLRDRFGLSIIFITHDISTVSRIADRLVVMKLGQIVEQGGCSDVLSNPREPYTQKLLNSVPRAEKGWLESAYRKMRDQNQLAS